MLKNTVKSSEKILKAAENIPTRVLRALESVGNLTHYLIRVRSGDVSILLFSGDENEIVERIHEKWKSVH